MHRSDRQRIGVEKHQPEIGLMPADERRLQSGRPAGGLRIKRGDKLLPSRLNLRFAETSQHGSIKPIIKMAAVPGFARLNGNVGGLIVGMAHQDASLCDVGATTWTADEL